MRRAFLLQFANQEHKFNDFPETARDILFSIRKESITEAMIFNAIERYEYIYYCLEKHSLKNGELILNVLSNQKKHLDVYAREIQGFNKIWTKDMSDMSGEILLADKLI